MDNKVLFNKVSSHQLLLFVIQWQRHTTLKVYTESTYGGRTPRKYSNVSSSIGSDSGVDFRPDSPLVEGSSKCTNKLPQNLLRL